jgi:5-(carboxyamino)imidazole ribonucleotide synthase
MNPTFFSTPLKLGILGGGQLGKMLLQCTRNWDVYTKVLDPDAEAPSRIACNEFVQGSLQDFDTVYQFGKDCTVLTIEIEHVNAAALKQLKAEGVIVHPDPEALCTIQDKGLQKMFFRFHELPTTDFALYDGIDSILHAIQNGLIRYPFVQKTRTAGYDGKGVSIIKSEADLLKLMEMPSLVEDCVDVKTEIAVIASRNAQGQVVCFDPVSMDFHEDANLLDLLLYPAPIDQAMTDKAKQIAIQLIEKFNICGVLAVEFLINHQDEIYINEVAPRPHNSGHQTIESTVTSQYEQHIRGVLNLPLGSTAVKIPSAMVNLLGAEGFTGDVNYVGIEQCLEQEGVYVHIYGKKKTKPFRKMGHITVTNASLEEAKNKAQWVKQTLQVQSL